MMRLPFEEPTAQQQADVARYVHQESNAAMRRGVPTLARFAFGISLMAVVLTLTGLLHSLWLSGLFSALGGVYALFISFMARRRRLRGWVNYAVFLPFVSLPSVFFLTSHAILPAGAATHLTGPYSYLYLVLIVATGFFFDARLCRIAGVLAGLEYFACYLLARSTLESVGANDPIFRQSLVAPFIYVIKSMVMGLTGFMVGSLAATSRRLLLRVLHEEREKQGLSRLFGQYVSPEVREKVIREKSGMMGERKQVAILFADLRGFTAYSEQADPTELVRHLNEYLEAMVRAVGSHGGTVDKFIGDAVMAVFGGVLELEQPAEAALDAAKEMCARLGELNEAWVRRGLPPFENGIGIHFGEVLQGTIGSEERKEFTVIGDAVNTAARLEAVTKEHPYPILVSSALVDALPTRRRAECEPLGGVSLKGKQREVEVFGVRA